jgi:hypothetical protein
LPTFRMILQELSTSISFHPDDRNSKIFQNVAKFLPDYMALHPSRRPFWDLFTSRVWHKT